MKAIDRIGDEPRFAAKLLFQFRVEIGGISNVMRLCEERIVSFTARSARSALTKAKARGKRAEHRYPNGDGATVHFEFVGVLELMHLGVECDSDEVWYDIIQRKRPMERASEILPSEGSLRALRTLGE